MFAAHGWAVVRSSRDAYSGVDPTEAVIDAVDEAVALADSAVHERFREWLSAHQPPDLLWTFREGMNNESGVLQLASSRNRRGERPTCLEALAWLRENAPGSYGILYVADDEDTGARTGQDHSRSFRVWVLRAGTLEEHEDPFLSPFDSTVGPCG